MTLKTLVLLISILFSDIALAQTMPITPYPRQPIPYLPNLQTRAGEQIYNGSGNNCVMTDFNTPVQGYKVSGSTGGLLNFTSEPTTDIQSVAKRIRDYFGDNFSLNRDVTIVVIDDFSLPGDMGFTHGQLVFSHINKIIAATGLFNIVENPSLDKVIWHKGNYTLTVISRNIGNSNLLIQTASASEAFGSSTANPTILNLSWVIIPCATLEDFQSFISHDPDFEEYVEALREANITNDAISPNTSFDEVYRAIFRPIDNDPLFNGSLFNALAESGSTPTIVASAGNFNLPFELFPAALNTVEGVAAFYDTGFRAVFTNYGQYHEVGAWFVFNQNDYSDLNFGIGHSFLYGGTSYSAPIGSIWRALEIGGSP